MEEWHDIPSLPGYQASTLGRIRSAVRPLRDALGRRYILPSKLRALSVAPNGYLRFNARGRQRTVHRAVLEAFVGPCPTPNHQAAHWDGDKTNCQLDNLRWATRAENAADKIRHGTVWRGGNKQSDARAMGRVG